MSETAEALDVASDVNDSQFEQFFESGGDDASLRTPAESDENQEPQQVTQEEPKQEQQQEQQTQKQEKMVPYGAMHEERMRRQELQQRINKMEQTFQEVMQRVNQPQEKPPAFEEDPLGALRYQQQQLAQQQAVTHQTLAQQQAEQQRNQQLSQFKSMCDMSVAEFEKTAPDYQNAYKWLVDNRLKEFEVLGYDTQTAQKLLIEDEMAIASTAFRNGANPAERIYNLAKQRGYQNASKANESELQKSAQKLNQMERGMQAAKSLGNSGGAAPQELTLEALANMDDEDFSKNWDKIMKKYR